MRSESVMSDGEPEVSGIRHPIFRHQQAVLRFKFNASSLQSNPESV